MTDSRQSRLAAFTTIELEAMRDGFNDTAMGMTLDEPEAEALREEVFAELQRRDEEGQGH